MFTGLVQDLGTVTAVDAGADGVTLGVRTRLAGEIAAGDSVAVNGVCLTATAVDGDAFRARYVVAQEGAGFLRAVEGVAKHHTGATGVLGEEAVHGSNDRLEATLARGGGEQEARESALPVQHDFLEDGLLHVLLRGKMVEDRGLRDADGRGDVLEGGPVESPLGDETRGLAHDARPHGHGHQERGFP